MFIKVDTKGSPEVKIIEHFQEVTDITRNIYFNISRDIKQE